VNRVPLRHDEAPLSRVVILAPRQDEVARKIVSRTAGYERLGRIDLDYTVEGLARRLTAPGVAPDIAIVVVADRRQMELLTRLRGLLEETWLVLVLPEQTPEIVEQAHVLRPRFLAYRDRVDDLSAVLDKVLG